MTDPTSAVNGHSASTPPQMAHPMNDRGDADFAGRLDRLMLTRVDSAGKPWTNRTLAEGLKQEGVPVTPAYISQLRTGERTNPTLTILRGLARLLGEPLSALTESDDEAKKVRDAMDLKRAMDDHEVSGIALRAQVLSPQALANVRSFIELARNVEGHKNDE